MPRKSKCKRGHPRSAANVLKGGGCRTCHNERRRPSAERDRFGWPFLYGRVGSLPAEVIADAAATPPPERWREGVDVELTAKPRDRNVTADDVQ